MNFTITCAGNSDELSTADIDEDYLERLQEELTSANSPAVTITAGSLSAGHLDEQKPFWDLCKVIEEADCRLSLVVGGETYQDPLAAVIAGIPDASNMRRHEQGLNSALYAVVALYSSTGYNAAAGRIVEHLASLQVRATQAQIMRQLQEIAKGDAFVPDGLNPTLVANDYLEYLQEQYAADMLDDEDIRVLHYFNGDFYLWQNPWRLVSDKEFQGRVTAYIQNHCEIDKLTQGFISNVVANLQGLALVEHGNEPLPFYIENYASPTQISREQFLLFENGMLDITALQRGETPELTATDAKWFSTVKLPYDFDASASCPQFTDFLQQVLATDEYAGHAGDHRIDVLQEFFGYTLLNDNRLQKLLVLCGNGSNGKSVVLHILTEMLGRENVSHVSLEQLSGNFGLQPLLGKTANICGDLNELDGVAEGILKQLTGQDNVTVNRKNIDSITMRPAIKLIYSTNTLPRFKDRSQGVWRRLMVMPFNVSIPQDQQNSELSQTLESELPGILNWAIEGLRRLLRQGRFTECSVCRHATDEHRFDCDPLMQFVDECIEFRPRAEMPKNCMYDLYTHWCEKSGRKPTAKQTFSREFIKIEGVGERRETTGMRRRFFTGVFDINRVPPDDADTYSIFNPEDEDGQQTAG